MTSRDELREAIAADVLVVHYQGAGRAQREGKIVACSCGFDGNYVTWRRHVADAVLAVLDQQGWQPGPTDDECIAEYDRVTPNGQTMLRSTKVKVGSSDAGRV